MRVKGENMQSEFVKPNVIYSHRVSYGETDAMGVLYYAEYLHIFERSRGEYSRTLGVPYREMEKRGIMLPVVDLSCRYRKSAVYDDLIHVRVGIAEWKKASLRFDYVVYDESMEHILATGFTMHACTNLEKKPVRIPDWMVNPSTE